MGHKLVRYICWHFACYWSAQIQVILNHISMLWLLTTNYQPLSTQLCRKCCVWLAILVDHIQTALWLCNCMYRTYVDDYCAMQTHLNEDVWVYLNVIDSEPDDDSNFGMYKVN